MKTKFYHIIESIMPSQYKAYCDGMMANNCFPLEEESYCSHISEHCSGFETDQGSGIYGEFWEDENLLIVSHWAPMSMRDGVRLLKEVLQNKEIQILINVLPGKMVDMLKRIGYYNHGIIEVDYPFRQTKTIMSNRIRPGAYPMDIIDLDLTEDKYESLAIEAGFDY